MPRILVVLVPCLCSVAFGFHNEPVPEFTDEATIPRQETPPPPDTRLLSYENALTKAKAASRALYHKNSEGQTLMEKNCAFCHDSSAEIQRQTNGVKHVTYQTRTNGNTASELVKIDFPKLNEELKAFLSSLEKEIPFNPNGRQRLSSRSRILALNLLQRMENHMGKDNQHYRALHDLITGFSDITPEVQAAFTRLAAPSPLIEVRMQFIDELKKPAKEQSAQRLSDLKTVAVALGATPGELSQWEADASLTEIARNAPRAPNEPRGGRRRQLRQSPPN